MASGSVSRSSERAHIGTWSMKIDAAGSPLATGYSNYIDLDTFAGSLTVGAWLSTANLAGCSAQGLVHFYNDSKVSIGTPLVWVGETAEHVEFKLFSHTLERAQLPAGCRYVRLQFLMNGSPGLTFGDVWIDGVQAVPGDRLPAWTPNLLTEHATLDDIPDGAGFGRVTTAALGAGGTIDLASAGIENRGALAVKDTVASKDIDKSGVEQVNIAPAAVGADQLATSAVTAAKIATSAVSWAKLASSTASLTRVSGGILTGSGSTATLPAGKTLDGQAGVVKLKTFSSMPTAQQVVDGEWFAVTSGGSMGLYVRNGTAAMNGAGDVVGFSL